MQSSDLMTGVIYSQVGCPCLPNLSSAMSIPSMYRLFHLYEFDQVWAVNLSNGYGTIFADTELITIPIKKVLSLGVDGIHLFMY